MSNSFSKFHPRPLTLTSLMISLITIIILVLINKQIATQFEASSGKTRALFGIIELTYSYKYFMTVGGILAVILAHFAIQKGETRLLSLFAIIVAIIAMTTMFLRIWTWMV